MTGIFVVKYTDGEWRGSMINEFGIKAFDVNLRNHKFRLQNVAPFLDKWYIRRTIKSDMTYLFTGISSRKTVKSKDLIHISEDAYILRNTKHGIVYEFHSF